MGLILAQVDAFTHTPFTGNPAIVCILPHERDEQWMQNVAREMNLSETAFLQRQADGFNLRWFTPMVEVDLCGHATLASAHILWEAGILKPDEQARFFTRSGLLTAERHDNWIELNFPTLPQEAVSAPANLLQALGVSAVYVGKSLFDHLVEVASEDIVRSMQPDYSLLLTVPTNGVMVTSRASTPNYDFVSRFFGPRVGINEDPVTGSAHCFLAPYWSRKLGKKTMLAYQASARGGTIRIHVDGDRIRMAGQAITIFLGELIE